MEQPQISDASKTPEEDTRKGFTLIEVMLFLAISGLLLMGVLGGTYSSIARQRYNDSVRGFAEFLRQVYGEVISPESLGATNGEFGGNSDTNAIYGKVIVFGLDDEPGQEDKSTVYTATLVGSTKIPSGDLEFMEGLKDVEAKLFCGVKDASGDVVNDTTVDKYVPLWQSQIVDTGGNILKGTVIIARSPSSGAVHTVYNGSFSPDLRDCSPNDTQASSANLQHEIHTYSDDFIYTDINFCIKSDQSNVVRDVLLTADGHNNTAINMLDEADKDNKCH